MKVTACRSSFGMAASSQPLMHASEHPTRESFNGLPALLEHSTAAFLRYSNSWPSISKGPIWSSYLVVAFAGLAVFMMGGIVPGLNALYGVLYQEGVFRSHCTDAQAQRCAAEALNRTYVPEACCAEQGYLFTTMSSVGLFASDGVMLLYGELLDRSGARVSCGVALALSWLGFIFLSLCSFLTETQHRNMDALWMASFFSIGVAGPGIFMSCLTFGECHPQLQSAITALTAAMWDTSSIVFYFFRVLYFGAGLNLSTIAASWLVLIAIVGIGVWSQLPSREQLELLRVHGAECASVRMSRSNGLQDLVDGSITTSSRSASARSQAEALADGMGQREGGDASALPGASLQDRALAAELHRSPCYTQKTTFRTLFLRTDTCFLFVFMSVYNLKSSFYIVTLRDQLSAAGISSAEADRVSTTFNLAFPIGGLLCSVLAMAMLNRWRDSEHLYIGLVVTLACVFSLLEMVPAVWSQYAAAVLFGPTRTLQWASYFSFLEQHDRYPPNKLGRMIGYGNLIIAIVGDAPPIALQAYVEGGLWPHDRWSRYQLIHGVLTAVVVCCMAMPLHLKRDIRRRTLRAPARVVATGRPSCLM